MRALRLVFALIRIPRLFASLILLPLILSLILVMLQLLVTGVFIQASRQREPEEIAQTLEQLHSNSLAQQILFGSEEPPEQVRICRWVPDQRMIEGEAPPSAECQPDRLDVALQVSDPANFEIGIYKKIFDGNVHKLHVCRRCKPDMVIVPRGDVTETHVHSIWGLWIVSTLTFNEEVKQHHVQAAQNVSVTLDALGDVKLHSEGFRSAIKISGVVVSFALVLNIGFLVVIALWLALKAHRKVLDYFAKSGALLPMVAATGKGAFYSAIWMLTLLRVGAFLLAAIPLTYFGFQDIMKAADVEFNLAKDYSELALWLIAIVSSLGLATIIASIADLKHRHSLLSFTYRYIPFVVSVIGGMLWVFTFIFQGTGPTLVRDITASLPIAGIAPILIAPVFKPKFLVLAVHSLLTVALFTYALKGNARWFAAHLEEL